MLTSETKFGELDESGTEADLSLETTQGRIYRQFKASASGLDPEVLHQFLLSDADKSFRQREIVDAPAGSVGPALSRLADCQLVDYRGHY